jgi:lipoyl synthase
MSDKVIPTKIVSGKKYITKNGISAIKDGIPINKTSTGHAQLAKPEWLKIKLTSNMDSYITVKKLVQDNKLSTVCEEAKCPNINECWSHGTATIMLMGDVCTRACRFCAVATGNPKGWLDNDEPNKTAQTTKIMQLKYVVLTSVNRDDLADGGALHYANTIKAIKQLCPNTKVEALTPDFQGDLRSIDTLLASGLDVFAQNIETVQRLTHPVRDPKAGYKQTLDVLLYAKIKQPSLITKTSLMLGLGETEAEILTTMDDLIQHKVDVLTMGQYLQPTKNHLPISRFVTPEEFNKYRQIGLNKGFFEVASGPLVRSSYRADRIFNKDNLGLDNN